MMSTALTRISTLLVALLLLVTTSACAPRNTATADTDQDVSAEYDPLEGFNRVMFNINKGIDTIVLRPLASIYRGIVPELVRKGVNNFLTNLNQPVIMANSILQGDLENAGHTFGRFATNSMFGFGLFEVAESAGVKNREEDFGQTLGVWGVGSGPYLVLPLMGPSSGRDLVGRVGDMMMDPIDNPWNGWLSDGWQYAHSGAKGLNFRAQNFEIINNLYDNSVDPYAAFRSSYLQRREAMIENRNAKTNSPY